MLRCPTRRRGPTRAGDFRAARGGATFVEFALVLPIMVTLLLVGFDVGRYAMFTRRLQETASTMAEMLARSSANTVTQSDLDFVLKSQFVMFPELMQIARTRNVAPNSVLSASLAGVQFKPNSGCTSNCVYTAWVAWTAGNMVRQCGSLQQSADTATPDPAMMPVDMYGPGFIVVADLSLTYTPMFGQSVIGTLPIKRSFYLAPRYVSALAYDPTMGITASHACIVP